MRFLNHFIADEIKNRIGESAAVFIASGQYPIQFLLRRSVLTLKRSFAPSPLIQIIEGIETMNVNEFCWYCLPIAKNRFEFPLSKCLDLRIIEIGMQRSYNFDPLSNSLLIDRNQ